MRRKVQVRFGEGRYRQTVGHMADGSGGAYSTLRQSQRSVEVFIKSR
jgi:hypothetical protein